MVPMQAASVGPVETWKAEKVSIWQAGMHDNPFGMRLTTLMILGLAFIESLTIYALIFGFLLSSRLPATADVLRLIPGAR